MMSELLNCNWQPCILYMSSSDSSNWFNLIEEMYVKIYFCLFDHSANIFHYDILNILLIVHFLCL